MVAGCAEIDKQNNQSGGGKFKLTKDNLTCEFERYKEGHDCKEGLIILISYSHSHGKEFKKKKNEHRNGEQVAEVAWKNDNTSQRYLPEKKTVIL